MNIVDPFDVLPQRIWPYNDSYVSKCSNCKNPYFGPKRSCTCWLCTSDELKNDWIERNNDSTK